VTTAMGLSSRFNLQETAGLTAYFIRFTMRLQNVLTGALPASLPPWFSTTLATYGPAEAGGADHCSFGTIWELTPSQGEWSLQVLYAFSQSADGYPMGDLIFDQQGDLYGVTVDLAHGPTGLGTVFKLTPNPSGPWSKTVLHHFTGVRFKDGDTAVEAPIFDGAGNLYGTTIYGGYGQGNFANLQGWWGGY